MERPGISFAAIRSMKFLCFLVPTILISACSGSSELKDFHRLEGEWFYRNGDEYFSESWEITNDTLMTGTSFMTVKGDTLFKEDLELSYTDNSVYYTPTIPDQNNDEPVRFKLSKKSNDKWIFENKQHDFPTEIIYTFKGNDSLIATVQGTQNGRSQKIDFRLRKK
jgi:hypothetical protein